MESLCCTEVLVSLFQLITKKTLFILLSFYAPYSDILASAEAPAPQHKDWVTLSAGSGYRVVFFCFFIPGLHSFDRHKAPSHINTHTHYRLLFCESKCDALPGLSNVVPPTPAPATFSSQAIIRAASCQPSFWYLYFHRILITLWPGFLCLPILSRLLLTAQLLFFAMWFQGADLLYSFMCTSLSESLIFLLKRGKRKALSHRRIAFTHFLLVSSRWNANSHHRCSASFFPSLFLLSHLFYVQALIVCCKTGINHNNAYDK